MMLSPRRPSSSLRDALLGVSAALLALTPAGCDAERATAASDACQVWRDSVLMQDDVLDLVGVPDIARIIHLSLRGQRNVLHVNPAWLGMVQDPLMETGGRYRDFGGAKLWNAPQSGWHQGTGRWPPDYRLDSAPTQVSRTAGGGLILSGQASGESGIRFTRSLTLDRAAVTDQVTMANTCDHATAWGTWSVLCVRPDGVVFLPVPSDATLWSGTPDRIIPDNFGWKRHGDVLVLEHPSERGSKIFSTSSQGWIGYAVDHQALFITYQADAAALYPDHEASSEVYAEAAFIELEHVGRLERLPPGASATFADRWHVVPGPPSDLTIDQQAAWMAETAQHLP
jgi:hypothetical protein